MLPSILHISKFSHGIEEFLEGIVDIKGSESYHNIPLSQIVLSMLFERT